MFVSIDEIKSRLDAYNITYKIVEHPPAYTNELADKYIEGHEGVRTKTLFLTDEKKKKYFMFALDEMKSLDLKVLKDRLGVKRLKFASDNTLDKKLALKPGVVSPFGLLNDKFRDVVFILDTDIEDMVLTFHPNTNEATIFINYSDLHEFLLKEHCNVSSMNI